MNVLADEEKIEIKFDRKFEPGEILLNVAFKGVLNESMSGFYRFL